MNVKSLNVGLRKNDKFKQPLSYVVDDEKVKFLDNVLNWLDRWEEMDCTTGGFSKETHAALKVTTTAIAEIAVYCKDRRWMQLSILLCAAERNVPIVKLEQLNLPFTKLHF
ncbi:unnamed protein product [Larinioides sclopetarius]|uniref:Uncharacterized protein n=1 Tax=Larinioides sclopetarius TaxID=280406 RepID=A0AAV1ZWS4_9ARAC